MSRSNLRLTGDATALDLRQLASLANTLADEIERDRREEARIPTAKLLSTMAAAARPGSVDLLALRATVNQMHSAMVRTIAGVKAAREIARRR